MVSRTKSRKQAVDTDTMMVEVVGVHTAIIAPVPSKKSRRKHLRIQQKKRKYSNKAEDVHPSIIISRASIPRPKGLEREAPLKGQ